MNRRLKCATLALVAITVLLIPLLQTGSVAASANARKPSWKIITSPSPGSKASNLNGVATVSSSDAWAVGTSSVGNRPLTLVEHWNGTRWSVIDSPNPGGTGDNDALYAVTAISANDVWAVGAYGQNGVNYSTLVEHWDGSRWLVVPSPNPGIFDFLYGVTALSASNVWAVGQHNDNSGLHPLIEHWNGSHWSVVPSAKSQLTATTLVSLAALSPGNIWAVGYQIGQGGVTLIEHWNGTIWSVVPGQSPGSIYNTLMSVTAVSANDVWAVGRYGNSNVYPLIEHWNGAQWSLVTAPNPMIGYTRLDGVTAISAKNIWAVGSFFNSGSSQYQTLTEQWNGTRWSIIPSPNKGALGTEMYAVAALSARYMWAVGFYWNVNTDFKTLTEVYS